MIAQAFGFTEDFAKEWQNSVYSRLNKILCECKDQARARPSGEKSGLGQALLLLVYTTQPLHNQSHKATQDRQLLILV